MDSIHDLKRTIGILVLETFKDKIHIGCERFSYELGEGGKASTVCLVGVTQPDEGVKGE